MKATNIEATCKNDKWFVTATVNNLDYQQRFDHEPGDTEIKNSVALFEINYAGLSESTNKPVKVTKHHFSED